MSEDNNSTDELDYLSDFQDVISQRAIAFCNLARLTDTIKDDTIKDLCLTMMRKVTASIKAPSSAELRSIKGGQSDVRPRSDATD